MFSKRNGLCIISLLAAAVAICCCSQKPGTVLEEYIAAHNSHDIESVMQYYADDALVEVVGVSEKTGEAQIRHMEEWDAVLQSRLSASDVEVHGNSISCKITEDNEWRRIAGIESGHYDAIFVIRDGLIVKVKKIQSRDQGLEKSLESLVKWVTENRRAETSSLFSGGKFIQTGESARKWLALLQEYQAQQVQQ